MTIASNQAPAPSRPREDDDDLDELPPLDGDGSELPTSDATDENLLEPLTAGGLDDATAEDEPVDGSDLDVDEADRGWLDEPADTPELDLGGDGLLTVTDDGGSFLGSEEPAPPGPDPELDDAEESGRPDSGEEGPTNADEELRDEDLPALDADEEGSEDEGRWNEVPLEGFSEGERALGLSWAQHPLARAGAPVSVSDATAVACAATGALVATRSSVGPAAIVRLDLEGGAEQLRVLDDPSAEVGRVAVEGPNVALVLGDGRLLLARGEGRPFAELRDGVVATDAALAGGNLWVVTAGGGLAVSVQGSPLQHRSVRGSVVAVAVDEAATCMALGLDEGDRPLSLVRGNVDGTIDVQAVMALEPCRGTALAARGGFLGCTARRGVQRRGPDGAWTVFPWDDAVTALAFVDAVGTLLAATYANADDTASLVRVDASGRAELVARLGPATQDGEADARVAAMAFDAASRVLWVVGGFGLATFVLP